MKIWLSKQFELEKWRRRMVFWGGAVATGAAAVLFAKGSDFAMALFFKARAWATWWPYVSAPVGLRLGVTKSVRLLCAGGGGSGFARAQYRYGVGDAGGEVEGHENADAVRGKGISFKRSDGQSCQSAGARCLMRSNRSLALSFIGFVLLVGPGDSPAAPAGNILPTVIDFPGASGTRAYGINKVGEIVGAYTVSSPGSIRSHGFLLIGGSFKSIDFPDSFGTEAYGINAAGEIVGVYWDAQGAAIGSHGFLLSGGRFTRIDHPHAVVTRALGINDSGQIVGVYTLRRPCGIPGCESSGRYAHEDGHGFVYAQGRFTNVDFPGAAHGEQTAANAINAAGQLAGTYFDRNYVAHGFLLTKGNYSSVDVPGSSQTFATGVSLAGQVVGHFTYPAGYGPGFILNRDHVTVIDFIHLIPGTRLTTAWGINDAGQVVGYYGASDLQNYIPGGDAAPYHEHGFMLSGDP